MPIKILMKNSSWFFYIKKEEILKYMITVQYAILKDIFVTCLVL